MTDDWEVDETEESEEQEQDVFAYQIASYPADITLKGYLDKDEAEQLVIPPFQRNYVWDQVKASKLIESFLLGLPVPGVFLYKERTSNKLSVIDGQQRILSSIRYFRNEFDEKIFRLKNVLPRWEGKTYAELDESDKFQLNDTVLRATVVQQLDPADDSSIYHIFERLNTGGINLNPMEIRKCVYYGDFFALLEELNENENWRQIIAKPNPDKRLRDVELVLRCLALLADWENYDKPMKGFLNSFMSKTTKIQGDEKEEMLEEFKGVFAKTCAIISEHLPEKPFHLRGRINYAALDSIFNAVSKLKKTPEDLGNRYEELKANENYIEAASVSTSDSKNVQTRFTLAIETLTQ